MTTPVLADRVMRARRETTCTICTQPIHVGQYIARCPGRLWVHVGCFLTHRHNLQGEPQ